MRKNQPKRLKQQLATAQPGSLKHQAEPDQVLAGNDDIYFDPLEYVSAAASNPQSASNALSQQMNTQEFRNLTMVKQKLRALKIESIRLHDEAF